MRIVADEGIDKQIVDALRKEGISVVYFAEEAPGSIDPDVLALAREADVLLLTSDKDFGDAAHAVPRASRDVNSQKPTPSASTNVGLLRSGLKR